MTITDKERGGGREGIVDANFVHKNQYRERLNDNKQKKVNTHKEKDKEGDDISNEQRTVGKREEARETDREERD